MAEGSLAVAAEGGVAVVAVAPFIPISSRRCLPTNHPHQLSSSSSNQLSLSSNCRKLKVSWSHNFCSFQSIFRNFNTCVCTKYRSKRTRLALKRLGAQSLVLERSDKLRIMGAALILYPNAWCALDTLRVAHKLISVYPVIPGGSVTNLETGKKTEINYPEGRYFIDLFAFP